MSKPFDRVWHEGLLDKLKTVEISGDFLTHFQSFLGNKYQEVVLNGQESSWLLAKAGVSQGSVLGPLLFLVYINDLTGSLESLAKLCADGISPFSTVSDSSISASLLNNDSRKVFE